MKVARIYAFGDSIVTGTYDTKGGWCDRLKQDMHRTTAEATDGTKRQMYNLGIGGETSRGLLMRMKAEIEARHSAAWPAIILIGIGKNDSRFDNGQPEVTPEEYEDNLRMIIRIAQTITNKIVLVGIGPCAEEEISFKKYTYSRQRLAQYNTVMTRVAKDLGIVMADVYELLLHHNGEVFYRDKLHLNDEGYEQVYDAVRPILLNLLSQDDEVARA